MEEQRFKCINDKCNWEGTDAEKKRGEKDPDFTETDVYTLECPGCGGTHFYKIKDD